MTSNTEYTDDPFAPAAAVPPREHLDTIAGSLEALVAGVSPDQWGSPTPCDAWTVKDLINHFVGGGHMFAAAMRGTPIDYAAMEGQPEPDLAGDDPTAAFQLSVGDFLDAR